MVSHLHPCHLDRWKETKFTQTNQFFIQIVKWSILIGQGLFWKMVSVAHDFSFLCRVILFVISVLCIVSTVACISGLLITDWLYGFPLILFVGGLIPYLRYLCVLAYSGVQHILCCVFVLFVFVLPFSLDCPFLFASSVFSNVYLQMFFHNYMTKLFTCYSDC